MEKLLSEAVLQLQLVIDNAQLSLDTRQLAFERYLDQLDRLGFREMAVRVDRCRRPSEADGQTIIKLRQALACSLIPLELLLHEWKSRLNAEEAREEKENEPQ